MKQRRNPASRACAMLALNWWTLRIIHGKSFVLPKPLQTDLAINVQLSAVNRIELAEVNLVIVDLQSLHFRIQDALRKYQNAVHLCVTRQRTFGRENVTI